MSNTKPSPYPNVPSRYLNHPAPSPRPTSAPPARENFATSKQWASVPARFLDPKVEQPEKPLPDADHPLKNWNEVNQHVDLAKRLGFGAVPTRFYNDAIAKMEPRSDSPRRLVEQRKEHAQHPGKPWQSTGSLGKHLTFDEMLPEFYAAHVELAPTTGANAPKAIKSKAFSSVGEYIRSGSPIRHHLKTTEQKERVKRHSSPQPFRAPGVVESDFDNLRSQTKKRGDFGREEARVKEDRASRAARQVPRNFTPRVARMTPAYQLAHIPDGASSVAASTTPSTAKWSLSPRREEHH